LKAAVSATGPSLDSQLDPRFGRCQYFLIVDVDTMTFEVIPNTSAGAMSGAGIQAAQVISNRGVGVVITGNVGPNAYQVLSSAGIKIFIAPFGTVREAVERFKSGQLMETAAPGRGGFGMGAGRGMGRGRGMGIGRGLQGPPAMAPPPPPTGKPPSPQPVSTNQEISMLESQIGELQQRLEQVKRRLEELRNSSHA
jgi:predicted Fe-Mo cluster-binding NifX family protein